MYSGSKVKFMHKCTLECKVKLMLKWTQRNAWQVVREMILRNLNNFHEHFFSIKRCSRAQKIYSTKMRSTPTVWKQYRKMAVKHFFELIPLYTYLFSLIFTLVFGLTLGLIYSYFLSFITFFLLKPGWKRTSIQTLSFCRNYNII